jgi:hypothetical protein
MTKTEIYIESKVSKELINDDWKKTIAISHLEMIDKIRLESVSHEIHEDEDFYYVKTKFIKRY